LQIKQHIISTIPTSKKLCIPEKGIITKMAPNVGPLEITGALKLKLQGIDPNPGPSSKFSVK